MIDVGSMVSAVAVVVVCVDMCGVGIGCVGVDVAGDCVGVDIVYVVTYVIGAAAVTMC